MEEEEEESIRSANGDILLLEKATVLLRAALGDTCSSRQFSLLLSRRKNSFVRIKRSKFHFERR